MSETMNRCIYPTPLLCESSSTYFDFFFIDFKYYKIICCYNTEFAVNFNLFLVIDYWPEIKCFLKKKFFCLSMERCCCDQGLLFHDVIFIFIFITQFFLMNIFGPVQRRRGSYVSRNLCNVRNFDLWVGGFLFVDDE